MTSAHSDPLYLKNARIVRRITQQQLDAGNPVACVGCGRPITPDQRFDVGHIIDHHLGGTHELHNLGPQHRRENRAAGGRVGATITNGGSRKSRRLPQW